MRLEDWLKERNVTQEAFAGMIGRDRSAVTRWLPKDDGTPPRRRPDWDIIPKIEEVTGGAVTAKDFTLPDAPHPDTPRVPATGLDLEQFRVEHGMSFSKLAEHFGLPHARTAQSYALGEVWPNAERLEAIVQGSQGEISVEAMHRRRLAWLRGNGGAPVAASDGDVAPHAVPNREHRPPPAG